MMLKNPELAKQLNMKSLLAQLKCPIVAVSAPTEGVDGNYNDPP